MCNFIHAVRYEGIKCTGKPIYCNTVWTSEKRLIHQRVYWSINNYDWKNMYDVNSIPSIIIVIYQTFENWLRPWNRIHPASDNVSILWGLSITWSETLDNFHGTDMTDGTKRFQCWCALMLKTAIDHRCETAHCCYIFVQNMISWWLQQRPAMFPYQPTRC